MTARIARIRRHPIKSVGGEDLGRIRLDAARVLPGDREWAVLTEAGERHAGPAPARWLPKGCFLRGAAAPGLQAVSGGSMGNGRLQLAHPQLPVIEIDPETEGPRLIDWLRPLWPADKPPPTRLVRAPAAWTDVSRPWVSILSLHSLRDLAGRLGFDPGIARWRANLWVEGWAPYAERDLIGRILTVGKVELRVTEPIGRCPATSADPETGGIDIDMPEALKAHLGHTDFGIYAEVVTGGEIALNDEIRA
ncbi:MOSC domain-containing protein [Paracoccus aminovorans]|uniref:MOSC domain-containing protein n=1 Tax=Paracoccus aminovorans TaxID=34004 RepID=UPI002B25D4CB|nr:MOSC domain-containing protein [Paracoccus aminovorans]